MELTYVRTTGYFFPAELHNHKLQPRQQPVIALPLSPDGRPKQKANLRLTRHAIGYPLACEEKRLNL